MVCGQIDEVNRKYSPFKHFFLLKNIVPCPEFTLKNNFCFDKTRLHANCLTIFLSKPAPV